jgi:hypothetical protein
LIFLSYVLAVSYNQPKFCSNPSWNSYATTFADSSTVGWIPMGIFIDTNNTVYVANQANDQIVVWFNESSTPTRIISGNLVNPYSLFVTTSGDIYVDGASSTGRIDKWTLNSTNGIPTMYTCSKCWGLFVDINNIIYCSMTYLHQVVAKSLNSVSNTLTIVAGKGVPGSTSYMLDFPYGIFVDINFDLYVADCGNNRIQLFPSGQLNGTTVPEIGPSGTTITLSCPTGIVLDADKYLYIVDTFNNRIVGSGPNGFRCLVGCSDFSSYFFHSVLSGFYGSASNELWLPWTLSFDSYGNMFVTDSENSRIQKFDLITNLCGKLDIM